MLARRRKPSSSAEARVVFCCQINKENGLVEASRIMNLYQFIQLYKDITGQAAAVMSTQGEAETSSGEAASADACQASMWMGRSAHQRLHVS